jgi:hypothetical protein
MRDIYKRAQRRDGSHGKPQFDGRTGSRPRVRFCSRFALVLDIKFRNELKIQSGLIY